MKKSIIFAALAAAVVALPSCSNEEEVNQGAGIKFAVTAGKTSRAIAVDNSSINKFHLFAVASNNVDGAFMNCDVTKNGSNWEYAPTKFWPQTPNTVNFFAYSAGTFNGGYVDIVSDVKQTVTGGAGQMELPNYTVVANADLDVLYAAYNNANKKTGTVPLNFHHALSQLAFGANCTNENLRVYIKAIKVENIANNGHLTVVPMSTQPNLAAGNAATEGDNWGKWTDVKGSATYQAPFYGDANAVLGNSVTSYSVTSGKYDGLLVMPQTITSWDVATSGASLSGSRFLIECKILSECDGTMTQIWPENNGEYAYVAIPVPAHTWKQGMRYVYNFNFNKGAGYTPDPVDPDDPTPEPVLKEVKIAVTVDEFQQGNDNTVVM